MHTNGLTNCDTSDMLGGMTAVKLKCQYRTSSRVIMVIGMALEDTSRIRSAGISGAGVMSALSLRDLARYHLLPMGSDILGLLSPVSLLWKLNILIQLARHQMRVSLSQETRVKNRAFGQYAVRDALTQNQSG